MKKDNIIHFPSNSCTKLTLPNSLLDLKDYAGYIVEDVLLDESNTDIIVLFRNMETGEKAIWCLPEGLKRFILAKYMWMIGGVLMNKVVAVEYILSNGNVNKCKVVYREVA